MKTAFYAYFRPTEEEFDRLWDNCLFTFDTNILLNFYRYQEDTKNKFLDIFCNDKFKNRLFLTYRVGFEFIRKRAEVISEQASTYKTLLAEIEKSMMAPLSNKNRHPHLSEVLLNELTGVVSRIKTEINETTNQINAKHSNDPIMESLATVFSGKISVKMDDCELGQVYIEGENRYKDNIPPGFKDNKKEGNEKFGDLVVWKQIMAHVNRLDSKKDVILVIDDGKDDWWLKHEGMKNPHPLLIEEFFNETGQKIYFYTSDMFLKYASERIDAEVSQEVINEVVEIREDTFTSLREDSLIKQDGVYEVISEDELLKQLKFFLQNMAKTGGYIGLKKFVTEYLASQDYEINHTYAIINNLVEKDLISITTKFDDALGYNVKVVEIVEPIHPTHQS